MRRIAVLGVPQVATIGEPAATLQVSYELPAHLTVSVAETL